MRAEVFARFGQAIGGFRMDRSRAGLTVVELMVAVAIIGVLLAVSGLKIGPWLENGRLKAAARGAAGAFSLARSEAIRRGEVHLLVFQQAIGADGEIVVSNDGPQRSMNCQVDVGETVHRFPLPEGVQWGTSTGLSNGVPAPDDLGLAVAGVSSGSSFSDATRVATSQATWVAFLPDGIPRLFTPSDCTALGQVGQGAGALYLTNQLRDYAVVLSPLGSIRVHGWAHAGWSL